MTSPPLASRSQRFRASPRQRAMPVVGLLRVALRRGARRCSGRASDPSRSPLCAASARGECALCLHVRVRALAAIMCMMCIACQTLPSIGSPFSFTACLCRRDDSTWSMTRWAPSEAARLFIVRSTSYGIYLHMTVHGLRRSCSGVFVIVIACLSPPPPSPPPPSLPPSPPPPPPPRTKTQQSLCEPPCAPCANTAGSSRSVAAAFA